MNGSAFDAAPPSGGGRTRRRKPAAGTAWETPVVVAVSKAPEIAASPQTVGLSGSVTIGQTCGRMSNTLEIIGRGNRIGGGDGDGLWVFGGRSSRSTITDATICFYFSVSDLTFSASAEDSGWTALVRTGTTPTINGLTAYRTNYDGRWTWDSARRIWTTDGCPRFTASYTGPRVQKQAYVRRSVTINGRVTSFGAQSCVITELPVVDTAPIHSTPAVRGPSRTLRPPPNSPLTDREPDAV